MRARNDRCKDVAAKACDKEAERYREGQSRERARDAGRNHAGQAGMPRLEPVAEQEGPFRQQGPNQAVFPSNQDAEPDRDDDREVNQVHAATPLSPMAPRNSTSGAAADLSRLPVEADHFDKALEGLRVAPLD